MAYSLIANAGANSTNATSATTAGIDTTGADLLVASMAQLGATGTMSDSKGNTWTPLTIQGGGGGSRAVQLFYCQGGTVGSGHTFTWTSTGGSAFCSVCVQAFSGSAASPFDQESGGVGVVQPGSITPSEDNELLVVGICDSDTGTRTIDSGFTITDQNDNGGNGMGGAMAYLIETSATAKNPSWSPGNNGRVVMAAFKAGAGGGGGSAVGADAMWRHLLAG